MKKVLGSGQSLLNEAVKVQAEFLSFSVYWDLEKCLDAVIEKEEFEINKNAIDSARTICKAIDKEL